MASLYDFTALTAHGEIIALNRYRGQVLLVVNVASECGFMRQYAGLQALYDQHCEKGFSVLAFPCNQFRNQEPGTDQEIVDFCRREFSVTFPVFAKIEVNGTGAHPLFNWLKQQKSGILGSRSIKWNFTKFLIGRDGQVRGRFAPQTTPQALSKALKAALADPYSPQAGI